jgi:hypothetical protein
MAVSREAHWGIKRSICYVAIAWSNFGAILAFGLWGLLWAAVTVGYFLLGIFSAIPRRCAVCSTRKVRRHPTFRSRELPPWWDLRPLRRRDVIWVCERHYEIFVRQMVVREYNRRQGREIDT